MALTFSGDFAFRDPSKPRNQDLSARFYSLGVGPGEQAFSFPFPPAGFFRPGPEIIDL